MDPISLSVALGIAGISAALKGLFSGIGSHKAAKENKKSEDLAEAEKRRAELKRAEAGNNYLDTVEGRTIANQGSEALKNVAKGVTDNAIKRGSTTEQRLAEVGVWQDKYNALLQNLAKQGTEYRKYYDGLLNGALSKYNKVQTEINGRKAQSEKNSWQNMGDAVADLGKAGLSAYTLEQNSLPAQTTDKGTDAGKSVGMSADERDGYTKSNTKTELDKMWEDYLRGQRTLKF